MNINKEIEMLWFAEYLSKKYNLKGKERTDKDFGYYEQKE